MSISANSLRHPKEKTYFTVLAVFSAVIWLMLVLAVSKFPFFLLISIPILIFMWLSALYFQAVILGSSVRVGPEQYPELHKRSVELCQELGVGTPPAIFIVNSNGLVNALAFTTLSKKYVFLYSSLVDLLLLKENKKELDFILAHEIGHHAAGHVSFWRNMLVLPGKIIPFLGAAYSRACELTADRIGHYMVKDVQNSTRALAALALGSSALVDELNIEAFKQQERDIPELMGFIHKLFATHPRTTRRVIEIEAFEEYSQFLRTRSGEATTVSSTTGTAKGKFCSKCGVENGNADKFCSGCGNTL